MWYCVSSIATEQPNDEQLTATADESQCLSVHADLLDMLGQGVSTLTVRSQRLKEEEAEEASSHKEDCVAGEGAKQELREDYEA